MIETIIGICGKIVTVSFILVFFYIIFSRILSDLHVIDRWEILKWYFCIKLSVLLMVSCITFLSLTIFNVATIFKEAEIDDWVVSLIFVLMEIFLYTLTLAAISLVWKNVYDKKIIPGEGTVKERIMINLKEFIKYFREIRIEKHDE